VEVEATNIFKDWVTNLKNIETQSIIANHISRIAAGNMGKIRNIGGKVFEKKIYYGAGYRLYFIKRGDRLILLLCGGDKSTQNKDIRLAHKLVKEMELC
jgi:putative addiction module killer protein